MPRGEPHDSCLKCLGEAHQTDKCKICRSFHPRTKKERDFRLKLLLMKSALRPQPAQPVLAPKPSTLVWSRLASVRKAAVLVKDPAPRDSRHRHCPASKTSSTASWHWSRSLVLHKKQRRAERGHSPTVRAVECHGAHGVHPKLGHSTPAPAKPALLTPAAQVEPSSPVPLYSLARKSQIWELDLPCTPDTFEAARDLREMTGQQSPAPHKGPVFSKGKPAMFHQLSPSPGHRSPRHRSPKPSHMAPLWSSRLDSTSELESYISRQSRHHSHRSRREEAHQVPMMPWPPQWQAPTQWPFWTPRAYHQAQGLSSRSLSVASIKPRLPQWRGTLRSDRSPALRPSLKSALR